MPRSIWNGTIVFGLVNVPIKLHSATESKRVSFQEVHQRDGAKIEHRRLCSEEGVEVPYKEVVKGYEVAEGEFVVLDKDEVAAAAGDGTKVIGIEHFVPGEDIDPVFYDRTYHLGAREDGDDAYRLLHAALEKSGRVGIGRFVFHNRERLVALRALGDVLALHTVRFADQVVPAEHFDVAEPQRSPGDREVDMAAQLVDTLHAPFEPEGLGDTHREAVLEVIRRKAEGEDIELPDEEPDTDTDDLMAALQASLEGGKGKGGGGAKKKKGGGGAKKGGSARKGAKA